MALLAHVFASTTLALSLAHSAVLPFNLRQTCMLNHGRRSCMQGHIMSQS